MAGFSEYFRADVVFFFSMKIYVVTPHLNRLGSQPFLMSNKKKYPELSLFICEGRGWGPGGAGGTTYILPPPPQIIHPHFPSISM